MILPPGITRAAESGHKEAGGGEKAERGGANETAANSIDGIKEGGATETKRCGFFSCVFVHYAWLYL